MILSKQEIEDIWYNKPVGYYQDLKKKLKKQKFYSVELQTYQYSYGVKEAFAVKATNKYEAELAAKELYKKKYDVEKYPNWKIYVREM